jgi:hypothetical protein
VNVTQELPWISAPDGVVVDVRLTPRGLPRHLPA